MQDFTNEIANYQYNVKINTPAIYVYTIIHPYLSTKLLLKWNENVSDRKQLRQNTRKQIREFEYIQEFHFVESIIHNPLVTFVIKLFNAAPSFVIRLTKLVTNFDQLPKNHQTSLPFSQQR